MNPPLSTALRPIPQWPARDLIRLWPWLLPCVLVLVSARDGFGVGYSALASAFSAWATVWMTFFIVRRLWGHHRAHAAATMLMLLFGTFTFGRLPMPDMVSCFLTMAAIAALVHRHTWAFVVAMGVGLHSQGPTALLTPLSAALGWWLAAGLKSDWFGLRKGSLRARHGLLLGLLPLLLMANSSTMPALALLTLATFVIAFCPSLVDLRCLWKLGAMALVIWLAVNFSGIPLQSGPAQQVMKPDPSAGTIRESSSQWMLNQILPASFSHASSTR